MESQQLKPGKLLRHGDYRIEKVIGQGGFGITYLATDLSLDRLVAIKEFFPKDYCDRTADTSQVSNSTTANKDFVEKLKNKFIKEARNIAKFDNPCIIKIHAAFEENNTAYYVMDYIDGTSLSDIVKANGPLPEKKALEYINKVGSALEYVHGHKINHLDIKPANIMIRKDDDLPILIDFGLSKQYDAHGHQTSTTPTGLSHGYAPLEQYNDGGVRDFSPQTDVYSLAATFYYILSGVVPPQATKLVEEELVFPIEVPQKYMPAISNAMSSKRNLRPDTVGKFLANLNSASAAKESPRTGTAKVSRPQVEEDATRYSQDGLNVANNNVGVPGQMNLQVPPVPPREANDSVPMEPTQPRHSSSKKRGLIIGISVGIAVALIIIIFAIIGSKENTEEDSQAAANTEKVENRGEVTDLYWESPIGAVKYSGPVVVETNEKNETVKIPDGKGEAEFLDGSFKGCVYKGEFKKGVMNGQTIYTLPNGDVFEGEFRNNAYYNGKYTVKQSGEYYIGTFEKGEPKDGKWYDKSGKPI